MRKIVERQFAVCDGRLSHLESSEREPAIQRRWHNVGGTKSVIGVCVLGAAVGAVGGHLLSR